MDTPMSGISCRLRPHLLLVYAVFFATFTAFCGGVEKAAYTGCEAVFEHKCQCHMQLYTNSQYVVTNCTMSEFNNTSILASISPDTEVVIFKGNHFARLPNMLFGPETNIGDLVEIDLSSNRIQHLRNNTFDDRVTTVTKLVLNDNQWVVDMKINAFHAFKVLKELHLAGAFDKEQSTTDILGSLDHQFLLATKHAAALQDLEIIHLENNMFEHFNDDSLLCRLPAIAELYLGNNRITHFTISKRCARTLRVLDLNGNMIKRLDNDVMYELNMLPQLTLDLNDNTFFCDCLLKNTTRWLKEKHENLFDARYKCDDGHPPRLKGRNVMDVQDKDLLCAPLPFLEDEYPRAGLIILGVVLMIAAGIIAGLLYLNRMKVRQCLQSSTQPILRKFEYSSIGRREEGEVDV